MRKVAIAISGQFRWHQDAINSIKKYLVDPNDADMYFVFSNQINNKYKKIDETYIRQTVMSNFLERVVSLKVTTDTPYKSLKPNCTFKDDMDSELEIIKDRVHPRNKKMEILSKEIEDHEIKRGKEYDVIIYVRPTLLLKDYIVPKNLSDNTVYAFGKYISGDGFKNIPRNWDGIYYGTSKIYHKASRNLVGNFPSIVGIKEDAKVLFEKVRHHCFIFAPELVLTYNWVVRSNLKIEFINLNTMYFYGAGNNYVRSYTFKDLKPIQNSIASNLPNDYKIPEKFINKSLAHLY